MKKSSRLQYLENLLMGREGQARPSARELHRKGATLMEMKPKADWCILDTGQKSVPTSTPPTSSTQDTCTDPLTVLSMTTQVGAAEKWDKADGQVAARLLCRTDSYSCSSVSSSATHEGPLKEFS